MAQETSIQDCFVTFLKYVLQYEVHQPEIFIFEFTVYVCVCVCVCVCVYVYILFLLSGPMSCKGAHSILTSMHMSV